MFSNDDIREIYRLLPPTKDAGSPSSDLSSLLISASENAFITSQQALRRFQSLVTTESQRLPVSSLGQEFDVDPEDILQIVRASPSLALLSENRLNIITKTERDNIELKIFDLLHSQILSKTSFSRQEDVSIESIVSLARSRQEDEGEESLIEIDGYFLSNSYRQEIEDAIKGRLVDAHSSTAATDLSPDLLPGQPPSWYISQTLEHVLERNDLASTFNIVREADVIHCIPKQSILKQRDGEIERLRSGEVAFLQLDRLAKDFAELHSTVQQVRDYLNPFPDICLSGSSAISEIWLSELGSRCVASLLEVGIVDLTEAVQNDVPEENLSDVRAKLAENISLEFEEKQLTDHPKLHRFTHFILIEKQYEDKKVVLQSSTETLALRQWQQLQETPEKDTKFQMSDVVALIPSDDTVQLALSQDRNIQRALEDTYWGTVSTEESKTEEHFSSFWNERVISRTHNYTKALEAIDDKKLCDQLSELLASYFLNELIPDSLSKARSQGLSRSRKTRKNIQKLESTLKTGKSDTSSVTSALEKFAKKQGVQELDESITGAKKVLINDMVRRMQKQKQKDGPLLFLTLVIVLLAKHCDGVVYATGKFAPKLLKQLKAFIEAGMFEQLENWKDQAKAGTLSAEDVEQMKQLAIESGLTGG